MTEQQSTTHNISIDSASYCYVITIPATVQDSE